VEEYLISKGVNPKIPPTPLFSDDFIKDIEKNTLKDITPFVRKVL